MCCQHVSICTQKWKNETKSIQQETSVLNFCSPARKLNYCIFRLVGNLTAQALMIMMVTTATITTTLTLLCIVLLVSKLCTVLRVSALNNYGKTASQLFDATANILLNYYAHLHGIDEMNAQWGCAVLWYAIFHNINIHVCTKCAH
jgi:hypothetical protein